MLDFLQPLYLVGLAGALVPLLLHLLVRRRRRRLDFSSLQFLREIRGRQLRWSRLQNVLLLLARMAALILLILALARPIGRRGWPAALGDPAPLFLVVVVDVSWSMGALADGQTLLELAKSQAGKLLDRLREGLDEVVILAAHEGVEWVGDSRTLSLQELRERVAGLSLSQRATSWPEALRQARALVLARAPGRGEVLVFTDLGGDWSWPATPGPEVPLFLVGLTPPDRENWGVEAIQFENQLQPPGRPLNGQVLLTTNRPLSATPTLKLILSGSTVQVLASRPATGNRRALPFTLPPLTPGFHSGWVELTDEGLALDNRRYFTVSQPPPLSTALWPPGVGAADPVLAASLSALEMGGRIQRRKAGEGGSDLLVVQGGKGEVLAAVARLRRQLVEGGGALLLPSTGREESWWRRLWQASGLPPPLPQWQEDPDSYREVRLRPEVWPGVSLPSFRVWGWYRFQTEGWGWEAEVLAMVDGQGAWIAVLRPKAQAGWLLVWGSPLRASATELVETPLLLPLLDQSLGRAAGGRFGRTEYRVGETVDPPSRLPRDLEVVTPQGRKLQVHVGLQAEEVGIYRLLVNGRPVGEFAVNPDLRELEPGSPEALKAGLPGFRLRLLSPDDPWQEEVFQAASAVELWRLGLLAVFLVVGVELLLLRL